jgi:hypothetical protein
VQPIRVLVTRGFALAPFLFAATAAHAQDIEPRAYSNAPVGVNFLILGTAMTRGALSFDASVPLTDASFRTSNLILAYARVIDIAGMSGKFDLVAPYSHLAGTADFAGQPVERNITGFSNPAARLSINLYGAPALSLPEFQGYRQDLIVGASFRVFAPWSQYDPTRLANIGTNRWAFKPELGFSKVLDRWTLEGQAAATFFTDNTEFFGGKTRSQKPLYSAQGHVIYSFVSGIWASMDATYFTGGRTTVDGTPKDDEQRNWRVGGTLAFPIDRRNSIKLYGSSGVAARTGNNFDLLGLAWQHRWGAGL